MASSWGLLVGVVGLGAGACSPDPPSSSRGATGALADDPTCFIYPGDGFASVYLGDDHWLEVYLPVTGPDLWSRGTAYYGYEDDDLCRYSLPGVAVRVQYGSALIADPDCDQCSTRYRALYVEGLDFAGGQACASGLSCDPSECVTLEDAGADALYLWCDSPEDFAL